MSRASFEIMKALSGVETDRQLPTSAERDRSRLLTLSLITAGWGFWYAMYRAYYGLGGTVGMFGTPVSRASGE
jgi:hypothetical protein